MVDVARLAGVSQQTVSRVVNGHTNVAPEIRERVERAIAQLRYRRNSAARSLATSRSMNLGVLSYALSVHGPALALFGIADEARRNGYATSLVSIAEVDRASIKAGSGLARRRRRRRHHRARPDDRGRRGAAASGRGCAGRPLRAGLARGPLDGVHRRDARCPAWPRVTCSTSATRRCISSAGRWGGWRPRRVGAAGRPNSPSPAGSTPPNGVHGLVGGVRLPRRCGIAARPIDDGGPGDQ